MTYQEFTETMKTMVIDELKERAEEVSIVKVKKNNGIELTGLSIREKNCKIAPTIYLEEHYNNYLNGDDLVSVMDDILILNMEYKYDGVMEACISDFSNAAPRITFRLINKKFNEALLKEIPYMSWNDLAIAFMLNVEMDGMCDGLIVVRNDLLAMWNQSVADLYHTAMKNMRDRQDDVLIDMEEILRKHGMLDKEQMTLQNRMFVLSNEKQFWGASSILYTDKLAPLSKKLGCNLYLIPSSIHEWLILPDEDQFDQNYLKEVLCMVNQNELAREDILGDSLYYFSKDSEQVLMLNKGNGSVGEQ